MRGIWEAAPESWYSCSHGVPYADENGTVIPSTCWRCSIISYCASALVWFQRWWWEYLLKPRAYNDEPWLRVILCRMKGHPAGTVYYNPGGMSPDYTCKGCGDDLDGC